MFFNVIIFYVSFKVLLIAKLITELSRFMEEMLKNFVCCSSDC